MNLEFSDGMRKAVKLPDFPGVSVTIHPLTVRQAASSAFDSLQTIRYGVIGCTGITTKDGPITTGAELADALTKAQATRDTMRLANQIVEKIMELTSGGADEKNSESSPPST